MRARPPTILLIRALPGLSLAGPLLVALALLGCGDGRQGGPDRPRATVQEYIAALTRGDARSACRLITTRGAREDLVWMALALKARPTGSAATRCVGESRRVAARMKPALKRQFRALGLRGSTVTGATACVPVTGIAEGLGFPLIRSVRGGWRVDGLEPFLAFRPMSTDLRPGGRDYHGCGGRRVPGGRRIR